MAQKKAKAPEPAGESAPMWIVSFADLVTLLMSFFVVLYALKEGGAKQQMDMAAAIKVQFDPNDIPPADTNDPFLLAIRARHGLPGPPHPNNGGEVREPNKGTDGTNAQVQTLRPDKIIVTGSQINFSAGESKLDEASLATIRQLFEKVQGLNNVLMIKGHVSADEIALRPDDHDGMALSYQRALVVVQELEKLGIDRRVLRPVACGPFEPLKTGAYDAQTLRGNRRVEIFTTDYTASDYFPTSTVQAVETDQKP